MQLHFSVCLFLFLITTLYAAPFQCLPLYVSDYNPIHSSISVFASFCFRLNPIRSSISVFASFCFRLQPYTQLHFSVCLFLFQITTLYAAPFQCLPLSVSDYNPIRSSISVFASFSFRLNPIRSSISVFASFCFRLNPIRSSISVFASFCFRLQPFTQLHFSVCLFLFQIKPYTQLHFSVCLFLFQITTLYAAPFQCLPLSVSDYNPLRSSISVFASFCFRLRPYMQLNFSAPYFNAGLSTMQPSRATAWMDNCSSWWQLTARFCQSMSATLTVR